MTLLVVPSTKPEPRVGSGCLDSAAVSAMRGSSGRLALSEADNDRADIL